eukprot:1888550-Amphidinium_carterae.2
MTRCPYENDSRQQVEPWIKLQNRSSSGSSLATSTAQCNLTPLIKCKIEPGASSHIENKPFNS